MLSSAIKLFFTLAIFSPMSVSAQPGKHAQMPLMPPESAYPPTLADLLTIEPSASIFYSYARELAMSEIFADRASRNTLLVPTNKAVMALSRKPHQGPENTDNGIEINDVEFDHVSKANVERWIGAHIIPRSPIDLMNNDSYATLLPGKSISFSPLKETNDNAGDDWKHVALEGDIQIIAKREASNGVFYLIEGTVAVDVD